MLNRQLTVAAILASARATNLTGGRITLGDYSSANSVYAGEYQSDWSKFLNAG